ncbi:hypothetical protein EJB05_12843, partial [Eragrostis curvula]
MNFLSKPPDDGALAVSVNLHGWEGLERQAAGCDHGVSLADDHLDSTVYRMDPASMVVAKKSRRRQDVSRLHGRDQIKMIHPRPRRPSNGSIHLRSMPVFNHLGHCLQNGPWIEGIVCDMTKRKDPANKSRQASNLDEANEMLSRGFKAHIYDVYRYLPPEPQEAAKVGDDEDDDLDCLQKEPE